MGLVVAGLSAGGCAYATLHVAAWAWLARGGWLAFLLMAPAALVSVVFVLELASREAPIYRQAKVASARVNVAKTALQIALFWSVLLGVIPSLLVWVEEAAGLPRVAFAGQLAVAAAGFTALNALGLWSGWTIARLGDGTPLPVDGTRRLVVAGPYGYVRNPMAVAGLGQGLCVAVGWGSPVVVGYVLLGGLIWNTIVRPSEEAEIVRLFGADYERYRDAVRCWLPRRSPYPSR